MKHTILLCSTLLVTACADFSEVADTLSALGQPGAPSVAADSETGSAVFAKPALPVIRAADLDPSLRDGEQTIRATNGRTMKTVIRNGILDDYADVYHPNGQLHSHTPLVHGIAQGWSEGYTPAGKLRTRMFYRDGKVIHWQRYNDRGELEAEERAP